MTAFSPHEARYWPTPLSQQTWKDICLETLPDLFDKGTHALIIFFEHLKGRKDITDMFTDVSLNIIREGLASAKMDNSTWVALWGPVSSMISLDEQLNNDKKSVLNAWAKEWFLGRPMRLLPLDDNRIFDGRITGRRKLWTLAFSSPDLLEHMLEGRDENARRTMGREAGNVLLLAHHCCHLGSVEKHFPEALNELLGQLKGVMHNIDNCQYSHEIDPQGGMTLSEAEAVVQVYMKHALSQYNEFFQEHFHEMSLQQQENLARFIIPDLDPHSFLGSLRTRYVLGGGLQGGIAGHLRKL